MKFVSKGPINNIPALVQIMAWRRPGDKPLSEQMMVSFTDASMRHPASMSRQYHFVQRQTPNHGVTGEIKDGVLITMICTQEDNDDVQKLMRSGS